MHENLTAQQFLIETDWESLVLFLKFVFVYCAPNRISLCSGFYVWWLHLIIAFSLYPLWQRKKQAM
jgi:hypothetical protein